MSEIYFYIVGYTSYEECPDVVLTNEKHYTDEQFRELCADITADIYNRRREIFASEYISADEYNAKNKADLEDDTPPEVVDSITYDPHSKFEDLMDKVIETLINNHGFKNLTFTAKFMPFGWADISPKDDWKECTENDEDMIAIRSKIK